MMSTCCSVWRFFLIVILCAALMAGCGVAPIQPTPTPEPVTLRFAFRGGIADYAPLAEEFQKKYPHITIRLMSIGPSANMNISTLKAQDVDVFRDAVPYIPDARFKDELLPLNEWIEGDKAFPTADMFPGLMDVVKIQGVQVGIPAGLNPIVAYYDNIRFKLAKVNPPSANWSLDDFLTAAVAVNNQSNPGASNLEYTIGFCSEPMSADPVVITYLMGGQLVDNLQNPTRPTLNTPANVRAVQWYAKLRQEYGVTPDPDAIRQIFRTRGLAEAIVGSRCGLWFGFYGDLGGRTWGTRWIGEPVMLPLPRGQTSFNVASVDAYYILRQSKHPRQAWLWVSFLMEHQEASGAHIPPRRTHIQSPQFASRVSPDVLAVARSLPTSTLVLGAGTPQSMETLMGAYLEAVNQVVRGNATAANALAAAQARAEALFVR